MNEEEEKKDKKEDGKKEKTKETEAADHSGKDLIIKYKKHSNWILIL